MAEKKKSAAKTRASNKKPNITTLKKEITSLKGQLTKCQNENFKLQEESVKTINADKKKVKHIPTHPSLKLKYGRDIEECIKMPDGSDSNFQYKEFVKSNNARRFNIPNIPTEKEWECIEKLVHNVLQSVRDHFGPIRITSGFRSIALCLKSNSSASSNHARGQASDFEPLDSSITLFEILEWISFNCDFRELIAEFFPEGWIHVAYREDGNDKILKLKDHNHNYARVDLSYIKKIYG